MAAFTRLLLLALAIVCVQFVHSFAPAQNARLGSIKRTIVMDGKTRDLRDRIKSIKNTRRITEAMRLVAAARVRRAQDAVLKTRPLIAQLQLVRARPVFFSMEPFFNCRVRARAAPRPASTRCSI